MNKRYLFLIRRSSDIDHSLPIVYALLKRGVESSNILITDIEYNSSNFLINENKMYKFLQSKKIQINFFISKFYIFFLKLYNKKFFKIINLFLKKIIDSLYLIKILFYSIRTGQTFFTFKYHNRPIKFLNFLNKNRNMILNLPHGFTPWLDAKKNLDLDQTHLIRSNHPMKNNKAVLKNQKNFEWFYYLESVNKKDSNHVISKQKKIFPLRYTYDWISILKEEVYLYKNKQVNQKNKIKEVTYFAQKKPSRNKIFFYDELEKEMLLHILNNYKEIKLNIRFHPSQLKNKNNVKDFEKYPNCNIYFGEKMSTFELILNSDIILGCHTSALLDAISLNKKIIILEHLTQIDPSLKINTTKSHEEFKNIFANTVNNFNRKNNYEEIYNNLIFPKKYLNNCVFETYLDKTINLK